MGLRGQGGLGGGLYPSLEHPGGLLRRAGRPRSFRRG